MAKLIYSLDGAFLGEFTLEKSRLNIGRRPSNDIHIDNLAVSGEHAAINVNGDEAVLEDLDSTNGTVVNGKPIKKHVLQHGDVIELGKYQLKYISEAVLQSKQATPVAVDYEKTMIIRPGAIHPAPAASSVPAENAVAPNAPSSTPAADAAPAPLPAWARPPASKPASTPASKPAAGTKEVFPPQLPPARIQVLNGPNAGKELTLSKALTTLGKPGVQVAVLTRRPHGYFVTHVEGIKHPVVNGLSVGTAAHLLKDHDVIEIAGVKMEFFLVDQ